MSTKHTPGPWTVVYQEFKNTFTIERKDGLFPTFAETDANARLIASAPELLVYLKELLNVLDGIEPTKYTGLKGHIQTLIDRAEGRNE